MNTSDCLDLCQLWPSSRDGTCPLMITLMKMMMMPMMVDIVRFTYNARDVHKFLLTSRNEGIPEYQCFTKNFQGWLYFFHNNQVLKYFAFQKIKKTLSMRRSHLGVAKPGPHPPHLLISLQILLSLEWFYL